MQYGIRDFPFGPESSSNPLIDSRRERSHEEASISLEIVRILRREEHLPVFDQLSD